MSWIQNRKFVNYFCLIAAPLMWSTVGPYVKFTKLDSLQIAFFRSVICFLFFLILIRPRHIKFHPLMVSMGVSFSLMNISFIAAIKYTTAANASILQYLAPLWVAIGAVYFLKEKIKRNDILSLAVGMLGAFYILYHTDAKSFTGVGLAVLAGVCYASVILHFRALKDYSILFMNFLNLGFATLTLIPVYLTGVIAYPAQDEIVLLVFFSLIQFAIPYLLIGVAIRAFSPVKVGVFTLMEPVLTAFLTWVVVSEVPSQATIIGGSLILVGLFLNQLNRFKSVSL